MALSEKEIIQFARSAVEYGARPSYKATPERIAKLLAESRLAALSYNEQVLADIRGSGWRVTQRVKNIVWRTLVEISDRAAAPVVLPVSAVTNRSMVAGGETRHPVVIMKGRRQQWVGFGWIDEGDASDTDKAKYPMVANVEIEGMPV